MNNLPVVLAYGQISLYNVYRTGTTGIPAPSGFNFGLVDQVSPYGISLVSVGQSVMFKGSAECVLKYGSWNYSLVEEGAIILREVPLP